MAEHNPIVKLRENPKSKAAAIRAMCAQCMGCTDEGIEPAFRQAIRECTASHCALYAVRPYQK